jgi:hypothetical protein
LKDAQTGVLGLPAGATDETVRPEHDQAEDTRARVRSRRSDRLIALAVLLCYSALAVALFHQALSHPATRLVGKCCDSVVGVSYLQSTGIAILHGHQPFVTTYLNAPAGVNALWQPSSSIALGVIATPFEFLIGPIATFDLFATLAVSLSGWSAYLVLRRWVGGQAGPIVGGLVFGFSSYMTVQSVAGHLDLTFLALVPPALALSVGLVLGRVASAWRSGIGLGVLLAVQFLINQEILADLLIAILVVTVLLAVVYRTEVVTAWRGSVMGAATAIGSFLVLAAWPLWTVLFGALRPTSPIIAPAIPTDLLSFVSPSPLINLAPQWVRTMDAGWFPDGVDQSSAYVGIILVALTAAAAIALRHRPVVRVASLSALVMALLSLGPTLRVANHSTGFPLPWALFDHLPFLRFDVTGRFAAFMWFGLAAVLAVVVRSVTRAELRWRAAWIAALVAGVALQIPSSSFPATALATPSIFTDAALTSALPDGGLVYVAPFPREQNVAPMQWQAQARMRFSIPGGYVIVPTRTGRLASPSGPVDPLSASLLDLQAGGPPPPRSEWATLRGVLASDRVAAVLVGPMDHERNVRALFTAMLGTPPRPVGGVYLWRLRGRL